MKSKLVLNQETLRNLAKEELRNVEGGLITAFPVHTCPECPTPPQTDNTCLKR